MTLKRTPELAALVAEILDARHRLPGHRRLLVGIAGAPGSGKSTLSASLVEEINTSVDTRRDIAANVPMDGFHLDNVLLDADKLRAVKGSPNTFDVHGLLALIKRLVPLTTQPVYYPLFDREKDLARNAAGVVRNSHTIVVLEGNYLLLDHDNWRDIKANLDVSVMLHVPFDTLEKRLIQRWLDYDFSPTDAREKAHQNDLPNAKLVMEESQPATISFNNPDL